MSVAKPSASDPKDEIQERETSLPSPWKALRECDVTQELPKSPYLELRDSHSRPILLEMAGEVTRSGVHNLSNGLSPDPPVLTSFGAAESIWNTGHEYLILPPLDGHDDPSESIFSVPHQDLSSLRWNFSYVRTRSPTPQDDSHGVYFQYLTEDVVEKGKAPASASPNGPITRSRKRRFFTSLLGPLHTEKPSKKAKKQDNSSLPTKKDRFLAAPKFEGQKIGGVKNFLEVGSAESVKDSLKVNPSSLEQGVEQGKDDTQTDECTELKTAGAQDFLFACFDASTGEPRRLKEDSH